MKGRKNKSSRAHPPSLARTDKGFPPGQQTGRKQATEASRGSATAEFALILPAVVVLLAFLLGAAATGISSLKLEEASRQGARALARGQSQQEVLDIIAQIDQDISASLTWEGNYAVVSTSQKAPGLVGQWGGLVLSAEARVPLETAHHQEGETP